MDSKLEKETANALNRLGNYKCEGQMDIFDYIEPAQSEKESEPEEPEIC